MKRAKRLTKKERKALAGGGAHHHEHEHIHCTACGRHLDPGEFSSTPATASWVSCAHGSTFASCVGCVAETQARLDEHDRTGHPVEMEHAWH